MTITPGSATTNFSSAGTGTPSVAVPSGAATGDWLYAALVYANDTETVTAPAGWTEVASGAMLTGRFSVVRRQMASGVTQAQWSVSTPADGIYSKSSMAMFVIKGSNGTQAVGSVFIASTSGSTSALPGVTVPSGGMLLAFAFDRSTSQPSVTAPAGMTERAKYINGGGGGASVLIASEMPSAGASGTRTVTYGAATSNRAGVLIALSPATGTPPVVSAGADAEFPVGTTKTLPGSATGATSVAWTQVAGPTTTITNPTSAGGASVAPTLPGDYVFRLTGTNADGSSFDEVAFTVTDQVVRPDGTVVNPGNYTPVVAATLEAAVSDGADTTWAESAAGSVTFSLPPIAARPGYTVRARMRYSAAPTSDVLVELMQGNTVISSQTFSPTTTITDYTWDLAPAEVSAITNRTDLRLRVTRL